MTCSIPKCASPAPPLSPRRAGIPVRRCLSVEAVDELSAIGAVLDLGKFPAIWSGGVVQPGTSIAITQPTGEDFENVESERASRPEARPRQGTAGWEGATGRSRETGAPASVVRDYFRSHYLNQLAELTSAYPGVRFCVEQNRLRLLLRAQLLRRTPYPVQLLCIVPFSNEFVRAWGFWECKQWIGPRHTNFPDGSICAFEPTDGTWVPGDSLVSLVDLYTVWAIRHLYLDVFGRWPGFQSVHFRYEQALELHPDEYCGCQAAPSKRYRDCCYLEDQEQIRLADAIAFNCATSNGLRRPPVDIVETFAELHAIKSMD